MVIEVPGWLEYFFGRLLIKVGGVALPWRSNLSFQGTAVLDVVDDEETDTITTTIDGGGPGQTGQITIDVDADYVLDAGEAARAVQKWTGVLTADRTLTYPAAATDDDVYTRVFRNETDAESAGSVIVTTGSGATFSVPPGCSLTLGFDPDGVFAVNTGAP